MKRGYKEKGENKNEGKGRIKRGYTGEEREKSIAKRGCSGKRKEK